MAKFRPFQAELSDKIHNAWATGARNVMAVAATGSGKTVVLSQLMSEEQGVSVAIAHRQELVSQISVALARNGVRHGLLGDRRNKSLIRIISALHIAETGRSYFDPNSRTHVGGVDTVVRMATNNPIFAQTRLIVQDEGHHVLRENKWGRVAALFPNARGLYPTATPLRADGKGLGRHADGLMDAMVLAPSMREIINMGYLTDYRIFSPPSDLNLTNVAISKTTGDFNADQLRKAVHGSHITGDVVEHYLKLASGQLGVTFAVDVAAAAEIAAAYRAKGVSAEVVSAKTPDDVRAQILRRFRNREILQLVNVDLFGEGFDLPAISVVSFARPTESFALFSQQFGRSLRLMLPTELSEGYGDLTDVDRRNAIRSSDKPVAIVIDHVGNVLRHGLPDAPRDWSLDRRDRRAKKSSDSPPLRICANPECVQPYERFYKCCPHCGFYPEPAVRSSPEYVDGDLTELDAATLAALRGDIDRIDGPFYAPGGLEPIAIMGARKRHVERQQAQGNLRNAIAWWAGVEAARGHTESESYRRFYHKFGVDVAGAQILGVRAADDLARRVNIEIGKFGIDGSVSASVYFENDR